MPKICKTLSKELQSQEYVSLEEDFEEGNSGILSLQMCQRHSLFAQYLGIMFTIALKTSN